MQTYNLYPSFVHWFHGGQIYFYSDPHFGDELNHSLRPNNVDDATQIANINSKVGKNDTIIILGDICDTSWVKKIRGYKVLITGNHDAGATNYQRITKRVQIDCDKYFPMSLNEMYIEAIHRYPDDADLQEKYISQLESDAWHKAYDELKSDPDFVYLSNESVFAHHSPFTCWVAYYDNKLFDEVYTGPLTISPQIILSHEPILNYPFALNIHGHDHGAKVNSPLHYNMCAELINYTPVALKDIAKSGALHKPQDIHRTTIINATNRTIRHTQLNETDKEEIQRNERIN